jgi:hypothetical protein
VVDGNNGSLVEIVCLMDSIPQIWRRSSVGRRGKSVKVEGMMASSQGNCVLLRRCIEGFAFRSQSFFLPLSLAKTFSDNDRKIL